MHTLPSIIKLDDHSVVELSDGDENGVMHTLPSIIKLDDHSVLVAF